MPNQTTEEEEPIPFDQLSDDDKDAIIRHFKEAMFYRSRQWDAEREIERIIKCEIDVDMGCWASLVGYEEQTPEEIEVDTEDIFEEIKAAITKALNWKPPAP